jgi:LPS sulfotransferase NodH
VSNSLKHIQVVAGKRSGSTYLTELILKYNTCYKGLFSPFHLSHIPNNKIYKHSKKLSADLNNLKQQYVVKTHYCDLPSLNSFIKDRNLEIDKFYNIFLIRCNLLDSILSLALARATNQWGWGNYQYEDKVALSSENLLHCIRAQIKDTDYSLKNTYNIQYSEIIKYEDLSINPSDAYSSLKISKNQRHHKLYQLDDFTTKISPSKNTIITNFDQAKSFVLEYLPNVKSTNMEIKDGIITSFRLENQTL